jgi:hypothetical protein
MAVTSGSAFAQGKSTYETHGHAFNASLGRQTAPVTGRFEREIDSSGKGGNADHMSFLVPNYGGTSSGPAS